MPPDTVREFDGGTRLFLPARLGDNPFLRKADAGYEKRLKLLSPTDRKALLDGVWELNEGQYFSEFSRDLHVVKPYAIPHDWRRCLTIDYGLDMLAALWIAQSPDGHSVVYRELYRPGLIIRCSGAELACETAENASTPSRAARSVEPTAGNRQKRGRAVRGQRTGFCQKQQ